ncbi:MAG: transposase [Pleurocapsa sp. SU_196_0]|nr:transposase [Pleurocapsa sp. SU_196_0]
MLPNTDDVDRCRNAGIPNGYEQPKTKAEMALEEIDRVRAAGVEFGVVLADAGYCGADFRKALSARGFTWAVGVPRHSEGLPARGARLATTENLPGSQAQATGS